MRILFSGAAPGMSSDPSNPHLSSSNSSISPPSSWLPEMVIFAQHLAFIGEDPKSILILLETQWPEVTDTVKLEWLKHLRGTEE
jgi:hypothetical protein